MTTSANAQASLNGREGYIVMKALIYAVARIQSLPRDRQEYSDMIATCALVRESAPAMFSSTAPERFASFVWEVESHVGHEIDLWPSEGGDGINGAYTDEELDTKESLRALITAMEAQRAANPIELNAPQSEVVAFI
jgi:hypothetical protein